MDNCALLKQRIGAYQSALWEMTLYLDTHPDCPEALEKYREYRAMVTRLIEEYEEQFGPWVVTSADVHGSFREWVNGPWPWEGKGGN